MVEFPEEFPKESIVDVLDYWNPWMNSWKTNEQRLGTIAGAGPMGIYGRNPEGIPRLPERIPAIYWLMIFLNNSWKNFQKSLQEYLHEFQEEPLDNFLNL